jgi:hypothetical protein
MPVKRCTKNGRAGYKWGDRGTCYTGTGAKARATAQGRAAYANGYRGTPRKTNRR